MSIYDSTVARVGTDISSAIRGLGNSIVQAAQILAEAHVRAAKIQKGE